MYLLFSLVIIYVCALLGWHIAQKNDYIALIVSSTWITGTILLVLYITNTHIKLFYIPVIFVTVWVAATFSQTYVSMAKNKSTRN